MLNKSSKNPDFIGIGVQKAGTTWLHRKLVKHPQIWMALKKELHFFDRSPHYPSPNDLAISSPFVRIASSIVSSKSWERRRTISNSSRIVQKLRQGNFEEASWYFKWTFGYYDENWYSNLFSPAKPDQITGEITPEYSILDREDVARISTVNPDVKLIFLVRNPIDRAWSQVRYYNGMQQRRSTQKQITSIDEMMSFLKSDYVILHGDYERTLDNYLAYFDSSQILIGFYDAIIDNQSGLLSGIADFLGVSPFEEEVLESEIRVNVSPLSSMPQEVKDYLMETYTPPIERLAKYLGSYAARWYDELGQDINTSSSNSPKTLLSPVVHP